jgi:hypothetical protein
MLSLLLCVAVVALWVRSAWVEDWIVRRRLHEPVGPWVGATDWMFCTNRGVAHAGVWVFVWDSTRFDFSWRGRGDGWRWEAERGRPAASGLGIADALGFGYHAADPAPSDNETWTRSVTFPLWLPAVLFAVIPTVRGCRHLRRRLAYARGLCRRCGYDLRATPGRCPECGSVAAVAESP